MQSAATRFVDIVLPADRAAELCSRLAAVIGDGGVQVGGDTLLIVAQPG